MSNSIYPQNETELKKIVSVNLKRLAELKGKSESQLGADMGSSGPTVSTYFSASNFPKITYIVNLCNNEEYDINGTHLTVDDIICNDSRILSVPLDSAAPVSVPAKAGTAQSDMSGAYCIYFYDTAAGADDRSGKPVRPLVCGVAAILAPDNESGPAEVIASSFTDLAEAETVKNKIDCFIKGGVGKEASRSMIADAFENRQKYAGTAVSADGGITFDLSDTDSHSRLFIVVSDSSSAMRSGFKGGLGIMASFSTVGRHEPSCRRVLISRAGLSRVTDTIREKLAMFSGSEADFSEAAKELARGFSSLYSMPSETFSDGDREYVIAGRLGRVLTEYIRVNCLHAAAVSGSENDDAVNLIESAEPEHA